MAARDTKSCKVSRERKKTYLVEEKLWKMEQNPPRVLYVSSHEEPFVGVGDALLGLADGVGQETVDDGVVQRAPDELARDAALGVKEREKMEFCVGVGAGDARVRTVPPPVSAFEVGGVE